MDRQCENINTLFPPSEQKFAVCRGIIIQLKFQQEKVKGSYIKLIRLCNLALLCSCIIYSENWDT